MRCTALTLPAAWASTPAAIWSAVNSWSRNTVSPSFSVSWNQSRQVTRLPVQLWKYSCPMIDSIHSKSVSVATKGSANTYLALKMFRPLFSIAPMLKSGAATIMKRSRSSSSPKRRSSQAMAFSRLRSAKSVRWICSGSVQTCSSTSRPEASRWRVSFTARLPATSANR